MPRDASQQISHGELVEDFAKVMPGDLAFFSNNNGQTNHVGFVIDDGKIIHASGQVKIDHLMEEGIIDMESKIITHHLTGIKRVLPEN